MPDPEKQPSVEIVNDEPEENLNEPSQVTIDLDKKPDDKPEIPKPEAKPSVDISKLHNTIAYQNRKLEQALREMQELKAQMATRSQQPVQQNIDDPDFDPEIDEIAKTNWQKGVKKLQEKQLEAKVQEILSKREKAILEVQKRSLLEGELEKSKAKVLTKYPQIEEEGSEESTLYRQVINEDNSILQNVHGPEIAMYRMEERMRQMGKVPPSIQPVVDREVSRLTRAGASSVVGKPNNNSGKITLTKDQKAFCDHHNIPYERYATHLKAQEARGGVEV